MTPLSDIRPSPIAGTWYESDPERLARDLDKWLDDCQIPKLTGEVVAVIAPHAGMRYSGKTAAYAYAALRGSRWDRVAVISPMHGFHPAPVLTTIHQAYTTPLGIVPVDSDAMTMLASRLAISGVAITPTAHDREHSLEIQLPFLQRVFPDGFSLLPVMLRAQEPEMARRLGDALAVTLKTRPALLVASTDLSHFYTLEVANRLDAEMLRCFETLQPEKIFEAEKTGKGFACGYAAVAAVLWAALELGANKVQILYHSTSAEETHDPSEVVGYGAAVILRE